MEPMAIKCLQESPELKKEFEQKITTDSKFAANPNAIGWFYSKTKYYDKNYLLYPVGENYN
jgi:hypothetical protein